MAKDITLKTRNGETRYPKTVTAIVYENGTGKTLQTIIEEMRQVDAATNTRTQHFKADVDNLDTLKNKTDIGLYNYVGTGWRGSVSVCYDSADNVSQVALSSSTPSYNGNTLTWISAQPCAMARTYTNGAWSHWEKVGAPVVNDLTTGGTDKALSAEMGKTLKEGMDALGPESCYDVTARNSGATFASLAALLSNANLSTLVPTSVRIGGMSIRFVQTSDNKYVQYMCKSSTWSINSTDWEKINNVSVSQNTETGRTDINIGGEITEIPSIKDIYGDEVNDSVVAVSGVAVDGKFISPVNYPLSVGDKIFVRVDSTAITRYILQDINGNRLCVDDLLPNTDNVVTISTAPTANYGIRVSSNSVIGNGSVSVKVIFGYEDAITTKINQLSERIGDNSDAILLNETEIVKNTGRIEKLEKTVGIPTKFSSDAVSGNALDLKPISVAQYPLSVGDTVFVRVNSSVISAFFLQDVNGNRLYSTKLNVNEDYYIKITTAPNSNYGIRCTAEQVTGSGTVDLLFTLSYKTTLDGRIVALEGLSDDVNINTDILTRFNLFDVLTAETTTTKNYSIEALMRTGILKYIRIIGIPTTKKFSLMFLGRTSINYIFRIVEYGTNNLVVNYIKSVNETPSNHIVVNNLLGDGKFEAYIDWSRIQSTENSYIIGSQTEANKNQIFVGCYEPMPELTFVLSEYYRKVAAQQINAYKQMLSNTAKTLMKGVDDVRIAILGDSIWAGVGPSEFSDSEAKFLPPIMSNPNPSYWMYKYGVKNKADWFRYDSGVITETGTWTTELSKFNEWSGVHVPDGKPYGRSRQSNSTNASVSFDWDLSVYKKMSFVHRLRYDGVSKVVISVSGGNGKILVKHNQLANPIANMSDNEWVEANGYEFTQLVPSASAQQVGTDSFANFMTYFKAVDGITDNVTITFARNDSDTSRYMYYWGFSIWNGRTILFDNCARGGITLGGIIGHCADDLEWRHPDFVMLEIPLANTVNGGAGRSYQEIYNYLLGWLYQEGPSADANTYYGASIAANNIANYVIAGKVIYLVANYFSKWVEADKNAFTTLAQTESSYQDRNCEMMYDAARLVLSQKEQQYIDYATIALSIADERNMLWRTILSAQSGTEPTLCSDGIHPSILGAFIQGYIAGNVLLDC